MILRLFFSPLSLKFDEDEFWTIKIDKSTNKLEHAVCLLRRERQQNTIQIRFLLLFLLDSELRINKDIRRDRYSGHEKQKW